MSSSVPNGPYAAVTPIGGTSVGSEPVAQLLVDLGVARFHSRPPIKRGFQQATLHQVLAVDLT